MTSIKRISYAYNSVLEDLGENAYFLDALVTEDKETLVDVHQQFKGREEFLAAVEGIIPLVGGQIV